MSLILYYTIKFVSRTYKLYKILQVGLATCKDPKGSFGRVQPTTLPAR